MWKKILLLFIQMKKYNQLIFIFSFYMVAGLFIFTKPLGDLDELWNFSFAWNCARGLLPYQDFNMVQTPGFALLASLFLRVFGQELMVFRVCAVFLCGSILAITYGILRILQMDWDKAYLYSIILSLFMGYFFAYDYNFLNLFLLLIVVCLELKKGFGFRLPYSLSIGLICGLSILVKQTTGMLFCMASLVVAALFTEFKKKWEVICRLVVILSVLLSFLLYYWRQQSLAEFWEYCFQGIKYFKNYITLSDYLKLGPIPCIYLGGIVVYVGYWVSRIALSSIRKQQMEPWRKMILLYGFASCSLVYPIFDEIHLRVGVYPVMVLMLLDLGRRTVIRQKRDFAIACISLGAVAATAVWLLWPEGKLQASSLPHYKGIPIQQTMEERIIAVDRCISTLEQEGKEVYLLDASAVAYLLPLDRYHKDYDLMLKGNTGNKSPEALTRQLCRDSVAVLILGSSYETNWQFPETVREIIHSEMDYQDSISVFDIYEMK